MYEPYMEHSGIKGMHWGVRRYQNPDGSLTPAGRSRYGVGPARKVKTTVGSVVKGIKRSASNTVSRVKKYAATRRKKSIENLVRSGNIGKLSKKASRLTNSQLDDAIARANKISDAKAKAGPKQDVIDKINRVIGTIDKGAKAAKNIYDYKNAKMDYKKKKRELHDLIVGASESKKEKKEQDKKTKPNKDLQNARDESNRQVEEAIQRAKNPDTSDKSNKPKKPTYGEKTAAERDAFAKKLAENARARREPGYVDPMLRRKEGPTYGEKVATKRHEFAKDLAKNARKDYVDRLMEKAKKKVRRKEKWREFWYG